MLLCENDTVSETEAILAKNLKPQIPPLYLLSKYLERAAFYGLLVGAIIAAIPYGTVDSWFKLLFVLLVCICAVCRVSADWLSGEFSIAEWRLLSPLLGILLLAVFQTIPFFGFIFSQSEKTISLDTFETKNFILIFAGLLMTAEIFFKYTTTKKRLKRLIFTVVFIGTGSALFGLLRLIFPQVENIFFPELVGQKVQFAQFVNRNHFALLMEMTLGLLLGLLLKTDLSKHLKLLFLALIWLICFVVISANSRGGIISAAGLGLFAVFTHFLTTSRWTSRTARKSFLGSSVWQRKPAIKALAFSFLLLTFVILTVAFVGGDSVVSRLETISSEVGANENHKVRRLEIWKATLDLIENHPATGAGFGAYAVAITKYDHSTGKFVLQQAHNDYLEIMANGGIAASLLTLIFLAILFRRIRMQFASGADWRRASRFGAVAGIVGVFIHSTVDFGLHVIVNALVFIILIVIATARISDESRDYVRKEI